MKFLEHQGYKVDSSILYQDNESAIRLEKNAQRSSSRRTRHLDIKYFWVKDQLEREGIKVLYCPTESMIADFLTKPLQGATFKLLKDIVMGVKPISILNLASDADSAQRSVLGKDQWRQPVLIMVEHWTASANHKLTYHNFGKATASQFSLVVM